LIVPGTRNSWIAQRVLRTFTWIACVFGLGTGCTSITAVTPDPALAGTIVTISGAGFGPSAGIVTYDDAPIAVLTWSDTEITATLPASKPDGQYTLAVTGPGGVVSTRHTLTSYPGTFQRRFPCGTGELEYFVSVRQTADQGFLLIGNLVDQIHLGSHVLVVKTDALGIAQWTRTLSTQGDRAASGDRTTDGGFVVAGYAPDSFGSGGVSDGVVIKLDAAGSSLWRRVLGAGGYDELTSIRSTADDGFIVAGDTSSYGYYDWDAYLARMNGDGDVVWEKHFGGSGQQTLSAVAVTAGGEIITAGSTSPTSSQTHAFLVKTDSAGTLLWQHDFDDGRALNLLAVEEASDGGYVAAGSTSSPDGAVDAYVVKTDSSGQPLWERALGGAGPNRFGTIVPTADGGFTLAGETRSATLVDYDAYLVRLDGTGNVLWERQFGGSGDDTADDLQPALDGGWVMAGRTGSFGAASGDGYLVKTDSAGNAPEQP
jgi:hypothetical protein